MKRTFLKIIFFAIPIFLMSKFDVKALDEEIIQSVSENGSDISEMIEIEIVGEWEEGASSQVPDNFYVSGVSSYSGEQFSGSYREQLSDFEEDIYCEFGAFKEYSSVLSIDKELGDAFSFSTTYEALKNGTYVNEDEYETVRMELRSQVFRASDAYFKDTMEVYWIRSVSYQATISYVKTAETEDGTSLIARISKVKIKPNYYYEEILSEIEDVNQELNRAVESINGQQYTDRYALVHGIYNYVKELAEYNYGALDEPCNHTLTGILLDKYGHKCTCEGYAKLIKWLCDYYDVPNGLVVGGSSIDTEGNVYVDHIWNVVAMEDGKWYLVDATWDDTSGGTWYFLAGCNTIGASGYKVCENHIGSPFFSYSNYMPFSLPILAENSYTKNEKIKLDAVEGLCAQVIGYNKIQLTWNDVDDAEGYIIYRKVEGEERFGYLYMVNKTDFFDIKAVTGKCNYYRVYPYCVNERGERILGKSETLAYGIPSLCSPKNLKAESSGKQKVKLSWDEVSGAEGYLIYGIKNSGYGYIGMTTKGFTYVDRKALDESNNFYWVYPYIKCADGKMISGACEQYVYAKGTCAAVTNLRVVSAINGVNLMWEASAEAEGYLIYGKTSSGKYGYIGMTTRGTNYTDCRASEKESNSYWIFPYYKNSEGKLIVGEYSTVTFR